MMPNPSPAPLPSTVRVVAGLGCRHGCSMEELLGLLVHSLAQYDLVVDNLSGLASIAHKRAEAGLQELAAHLNLDLQFFTPEALQPYQPTQGGSDITRSVTGSPAVAEPCAVALAARLGVTPRLLGEKTRSSGATCALATFQAPSPSGRGLG